MNINNISPQSNILAAKQNFIKQKLFRFTGNNENKMIIQYPLPLFPGNNIKHSGANSNRTPISNNLSFINNINNHGKSINSIFNTSSMYHENSLPCFNPFKSKNAMSIQSFSASRNDSIYVNELGDKLINDMNNGVKHFPNEFPTKTNIDSHIFDGYEDIKQKTKIHFNLKNKKIHHKNGLKTYDSSILTSKNTKDTLFTLQNNDLLSIRNNNTLENNPKNNQILSKAGSIELEENNLNEQSLTPKNNTNLIASIQSSKIQQNTAHQPKIKLISRQKTKGTQELNHLDKESPAHSSDPLRLMNTEVREAVVIYPNNVKKVIDKKISLKLLEDSLSKALKLNNDNFELKNLNKINTEVISPKSAGLIDEKIKKSTMVSFDVLRKGEITSRKKPQTPKNGINSINIERNFSEESRKKLQNAPTRLLDQVKAGIDMSFMKKSNDIMKENLKPNQHHVLNRTMSANPKKSFRTSYNKTPHMNVLLLVHNSPQNHIFNRKSPTTPQNIQANIKRHYYDDQEKISCECSPTKKQKSKTRKMKSNRIHLEEFVNVNDHEAIKLKENDIVANNIMINTPEKLKSSIQNNNQAIEFENMNDQLTALTQNILEDHAELLRQSIKASSKKQRISPDKKGKMREEMLFEMMNAKFEGWECGNDNFDF